MLSKNRSSVTRSISDPVASVPLWLLVSNLFLCTVAVVLLLIVLGNRVYGSHLSLIALVVGLLALACSVVLHLHLWHEGQKQAYDTERELEAVFEHALDAIAILDDDALCVDANPAAFAILGAPRSVLVGHSFAQFHEDQQEFDRLWRIFLERKHHKGHARLVRANGSRVFVHYTLEADYVPGRHVMILCDTTERVEALDSLREREELLQQISDNIREIVWTLDARTKEVLYVNGAYESITGRSAASILRHPSSYAEIIHPLDRGTVLAKLEDAVHTGHFEEEFRILRPDGKVRWVGVSASPVRRGDQIVRLVGSVQDITARKIADGLVALHLAEAEQARQQADDARAETEALHKATLTLTQDLRMDAVLDTLLQTLFQIVPYDTASVILTEEEGRDRLFVAREAPPSPAGRTIVTMHTGENRLLQRVLLLKKSVHLDDTHEETDWRENKALRNVRSWIAVPLAVSDNVLGLLSIGKTEPRAFSPEHFRMAKSLAIPAAVAIHNARLYEWAQIYANERQTLLKKIDDTPKSDEDDSPRLGTRFTN
jgi:PAS domain S-box-containing protein